MIESSKMLIVLLFEVYGIFSAKIQIIALQSIDKKLNIWTKIGFESQCAPCVPQLADRAVAQGYEFFLIDL